jgi:hypothetical protein
MVNSISDFSFKFNSSVKLNFDGGDLTSDSGGLLIEEFMHITGITKLFRKFKTKDSSVRIHTDADNLHQFLSQIFLSYYNDNDADELAYEHVLTTALNKERLASQPSLSRFFSRMDETTIKQLNCIMTELRRMAYAIKRPEFVVFDLDSTLLDTYGNQEGKSFNYHYQDFGYHPLLCYDAITKDLISVVLREGSKYCSKDAADFLRPIFEEYTGSYPDVDCMLRGDSGFASPEIYDLCEEYGINYVIRLKENGVLRKQAETTLEDLKNAVDINSYDYAVAYGEFDYQAGSWAHPRRVVFKIEKPKGQMIYMYTFVVTSMASEAQQIIKAYCKRGTMENFIKEGKNEFGFSHVSSQSMTVNANRFLIHALAYYIFNLFRRLALSKSLRNCNANTIRMAVFKIAGKIVRKSRYKYFKLCSNCVHKEDFIETLNNLQQLCIQLNE